MKILQSLSLILIVVIAACRSIPENVRVAHDISIEQSEHAMNTAQRFMDILEAQIEVIDDNGVQSIKSHWVGYIRMVILHRQIVQKYLGLEAEDVLLSKAYFTATQLLSDIDFNFMVMTNNWDVFFDEIDHGEEAFIAHMRADIARLKKLESSFDKWIKQFNVEKNDD